jgi:hypothetical protein
VDSGELRYGVSGRNGQLRAIPAFIYASWLALLANATA